MEYRDNSNITPEVAEYLIGTCFGSVILFRGDRLLEEYPENCSYILGPEGDPNKTVTEEVARVPCNMRFTWEEVENACREVFKQCKVGSLCGHPHCMIGAFLDARGISHSYGCAHCNCGRDDSEVKEILVAAALDRKNRILTR